MMHSAESDCGPEGRRLAALAPRNLPGLLVSQAMAVYLSSGVQSKQHTSQLTLGALRLSLWVGQPDALIEWMGALTYRCQVSMCHVQEQSHCLPAQFGGAIK
jgi:ascorbate-specific PTS system EIIC-type component UlaA